LQVAVEARQDDRRRGVDAVERADGAGGTAIRIDLVELEDERAAQGRPHFGLRHAGGPDAVDDDAEGAGQPLDVVEAGLRGDRSGELRAAERTKKQGRYARNAA